MGTLYCACSDLALEDMGELPLFKDTCHSIRDIIKFIHNHQQSHSMFLAKSPHRLLTPGNPLMLCWKDSDL